MNFGMLGAGSNTEGHLIPSQWPTPEVMCLQTALSNGGVGGRGWAAQGTEGKGKDENQSSLKTYLYNIPCFVQKKSFCSKTNKQKPCI